MPPVIDKEFKSLIQPLTADEFNQLEENILSDGCRDALVLWGDVLIDGHNRLSICQKHDITYQTVQMEFASRDDAKAWVIKNQFGRRNLAPYQRGELALKLKPLIEVKAAANKSANGGDKKSEVEKSTPPIDKMKTREEVAKLAGVSSNTIHAVEYIQKNAPPELIDRARQGGKGNSLNAIYTETKIIKQKEAGITTMKCRSCGKVKPVEDYLSGRNQCMECMNGKRRVNRQTERDNPSNVRGISDTLQASIARAYSPDTKAQYGVEELAEELAANAEQFHDIVEDTIKRHTELLTATESKQKIIAVLACTETAINQIKRRYLI